MARATETFSRIAGKLQGIAKLLEGYKGIFRRLSEEHTEVSVLMRRLRASDVTPEMRRELFPKIRRELLTHARAEEQELYSLLRQFDEMSGLMDRSASDHRRMEVLLEQLTVCDPALPAWAETFRMLCRIVDEHVAEEQTRVFPRARDLLREEQVIELEERYVNAKDALLRRLG